MNMMISIKTVMMMTMIVIVISRSLHLNCLSSGLLLKSAGIYGSE